MAHLKKGPSGHLLKGSGGHLVNACAADPCDGCYHTSHTDAVVTVDGACAGDCNAAGTYSYAARYRDEGNYCWTSWKCKNGTGTFYLYVLYDIVADQWKARLGCSSPVSQYGTAPASNPGSYYWQDVDGIACRECDPSGYQLTGSFSLDGIDLSGSGGEDCSGCTANVTLGGCP